MFPEKIRCFVAELVQRTEAGQLPWKYDDYDAVHCTQADFSVSLHYSLNTRESCAQFLLIYRDAEDRDYEFQTTDDSSDYLLARRLFDTARASGIALPFGWRRMDLTPT